jgi:hypothetical protein
VQRMPPHVHFPGVTNLSLKQICELPYKEQVWAHPSSLLGWI